MLQCVCQQTFSVAYNTKHKTRVGNAYCVLIKSIACKVLLFVYFQVSSSGVTLTHDKGQPENDDIDQGVFEDQSFSENAEDENATLGVGRKYVTEHYPHYTIVDGESSGFFMYFLYHEKL